MKLIVPLEKKREA